VLDVAHPALDLVGMSQDFFLIRKILLLLKEGALIGATGKLLHTITFNSRRLGLWGVVFLAFLTLSLRGKGTEIWPHAGKRVREWAARGAAHSKFKVQSSFLTNPRPLGLGQQSASLVPRP